MRPGSESQVPQLHKKTACVENTLVTLADHRHGSGLPARGRPRSGKAGALTLGNTQMIEHFLSKGHGQGTGAWQWAIHTGRSFHSPIQEVLAEGDTYSHPVGDSREQEVGSGS